MLNRSDDIEAVYYYTNKCEHMSTDNIVLISNKCEHTRWDNAAVVTEEKKRAHQMTHHCIF